MQLKAYKTFKALGILLWYPEKDWLAGVDDLCNLIEQERLLGDKDTQAVCAFARDLAARELFEAQETYVNTFDRVRSLSLHLFEHVHGEARDRGQAMVDLADIYKEQGFVLDKSELPDYFPVFLEYLSYLPQNEALDMLGDPAEILVALGKRLAERDSPYQVIFNSLIRLAGRMPAKVEHKIDAGLPSFAQMDKEWEEKPVDFLGAAAPETSGGGGCGKAGCGSGGCGGGKAMNPPELTQGARV